MRLSSSKYWMNEGKTLVNLKVSHAMERLRREGHVGPKISLASIILLTVFSFLCVAVLYIGVSQGFLW